MRHSRKSIRFALATLFLTIPFGCIGTGFEVDPNCSQILGTIELTSLTCDGVDELGDELVRFNFDGVETYIQTVGEDDCTRLYSGTYTGQESLTLTQSGRELCFSEGEQVTSCSSTTTSQDCTEEAAATNIKFNFQSCRFDGTEVTLNRSVTEEDETNDASPCSAGADEIIKAKLL